MTQEQAKKLTFPCKVRVTKAGRNTYWYSCAIGGIFTVREFYTNENVLIHNCGALVIDISDCELYDEPKEVKTQPDEQLEKVKLTPDEIYQAWKDGKVVKFKGNVVKEMHRWDNGKGDIHFKDPEDTYYLKESISQHFTIEEPVEVMFTPVFHVCDTFNVGLDYTTMLELKENTEIDITCILEHHKINGKWVFVKAHEIK